jgi:hypothetical protein
MRWAAMLLVPSLALLAVTFGPTLASACADVAAIHGMLAALLLVGIFITARTWRAQRFLAHRHSAGAGVDGDGADRDQGLLFQCTLGAWLGTLFCLVLLAQWIAPWILPACDR